MKTLLIRADATPQMGTGHIMRCLALAEAWQKEGHRAIFLSHCEIGYLRDLLESKGSGFIPLSDCHPNPADLQATLIQLDKFQASWLVLDGYHFGLSYHRSVKQKGYPLLVIDDNAHLPFYEADILLNQNINAEKIPYACDSSTELLLGTKYALLRQNFRALQSRQRKTKKTAGKLLVTLGGSDPENATLKVIRALQQTDIPELEARIITGPANRHLRMLKASLGNADHSLKILTAVSDMAEQMAWAEMAVAAGGTTCYELAFMGVPALLLILAENQRKNAFGFHESGVAVNMGDHTGSSPVEISRALKRLSQSGTDREAMTRAGRKLVDGQGIERVMTKLCRAKVRVRPARAKDMHRIWNWANAPDVRSVSFSPEPISRDEHSVWFGAKLKDPNCFISIAENDNDNPMGQVRYDISGGDATVSICMGENFRGKGYGRAILKQSALQLLQRNSSIKLIHAYIKIGNDMSIKAFLNAGFRQTGICMVKGQPSHHLIMDIKAGI